MQEKIILIVILITILVGCKVNKDVNTIDKPTDVNNSNTDIPTISVSVIPVKENENIKRIKGSDCIEADNLIEKFIMAINTSDIELLMTCVDDYDKRRDGLLKAIENYKIYFNNQIVTGYDYLQKQDSGTSVLYNYRIVSIEGKKKNISIKSENKKIYLGFDNFIRYSQYGESKLKSYINSLKNRDINNLAFNIWNSMEPINSNLDLGIYPISKAEEVLKKYEQLFDLETINYEFTGNTLSENGDGHFIYQINGKKNNNSMEHKVNVAFGDGQVGISDKLVPEMGNYDILNTKTGNVTRHSEQTP